MDDETAETLAPSWWLYRDLERNALCVENVLPKEKIIQTDSGVWIGKIERVRSDLFHMLKLVRSADMSKKSVYEVAGTIKRISRAEYETYLEFGAIEDVSAG